MRTGTEDRPQEMDATMCARSNQDTFATTLETDHTAFLFVEMEWSWHQRSVTMDLPVMVSDA